MPADKRTAAAAAEKAPEKLKPIPLQGGLSSQLVRKFASLSVADQRRSSDGAEETNACASGTGRSGTEKISPSDFVALQRLRSSTLACRTSTAFKSSRDSGILFGDLRNSDAFKKYEEGKKKQERKDADSSSASLEEASTASSPDCSRKGDRDAKEGIKNLEDEKSVVLLPRGPVRNARSSFTAHAPYPTRSGCSVTAPVSSSIVGSHERTYYQQQCNFENANYFPGVETPLDFVNTKSSSSTPDTVQSDLGYGSSSPHQISPNAEKSSASPRDVLDDAQLPEDLSDFILEYSRQYTSTVPLPGNDAKTRSRHSSSSDTNNQTNFDSPLYRILVEDECVSPLSAKSAPQFSPVLPRAATQIPAIFEESTIESICPSINAADPGLLSIVQGRRAGPRYARNRLRSIIGDREMSEAWVWTCKCIQELRGALCYQDPDGDSLLHIVILHMDLAKIYALVEQMLKADDAYTRRAFDMPNRALETPLHLAVQKNSPEIVAYLIEAGASPNTRTLPPEQQTPLHLAASQGMSEIVEILCEKGNADVNILNGLGQTPLLCAVQEHDVIGKKTKSYADNRSVIHSLLKYGANPMSTDFCGNCVLHYAVNSLNADLIEAFKSCLDEETITKLANKENVRGETPLESLRHGTVHDSESLRSNVFISLLRCGATVKSH